MKMRFLIPVLICMPLFLSSCEEDDICISDGTPNLTVVFRNQFNTENLRDTLSIYRSDTPDFENRDTIYQKFFTDSIKLPLGNLNNNKTYFQIKRRSNSETDILTVNYNSESEYVSKACGFRIVYDNLNYETTNHHIYYLETPENNELKNETITNLYIILDN